MSAVVGAASALFWGLLVLSLLVFIHEGGHFFAARAFGMRVTEFFLGLPSRFKLSHKSKRYGTEVGVTPFLLGGYTRICGMEGEQDELLAPALAFVQRHGRVDSAMLAEALSCDEERAITLLETLCDWGSIRRYDAPENEDLGVDAYETLARDANLRCEYDPDHDQGLVGGTNYGQPRDPGMPAADFLEFERSRTYLGKGFVQRVVTLMAGPAVNIVFATLLVVVTLSVFGMEVPTETGVVVWRPDLWTSVRFAFAYALEVASFAAQLIMPQHTMEVLESSSSVVGISVMASEAAAASPIDLVLLVASVSMSLGFMNLLPIPPLDGGKILIEVVQLVIRRPLSTKAQVAISYVGLAFFLFIFVVAVRNDIMRYMIG